MPSIKEKNQNYFIQLDGLRFIAISMVMIYHWFGYEWVSRVPFGSSGVNLFFVISGFLITQILLKSKKINQESNSGHWHSIKSFYIRRALRIFPIYFLVVFLLYSLNFEKAQDLIIWLISYTMYIYAALPNADAGSFSHFWSLGVEEHFYLFYPFLIFFTPQKFIKHLLCSFIFIGTLTRLFFHYNNFSINAEYTLLPSCLDAFGIGGILSYLYLYYNEKLKNILNNNILFLSSIFIFIVVVIIYSKFIISNDEREIVTSRLLFSIVCFWLVGRAAINTHKGLFKLFLENKIVVYLGRISYGLYVYHFFVSKFLWLILDKFHISIPILKNSIIVGALVYFTITLFISILSWHFIESPINNLKNRFKYN